MVVRYESSRADRTTEGRPRRINFGLASAAADAPLVLDLEDVGGVEVEGRSTSLIPAAEFAAAAVAPRHVLQTTVTTATDHGSDGQNAVGDEIAAEPVEAGADERADDDDRQPDLWIEVLANVEVRALADRASIDGAILGHGARHVQSDVASAAATLDAGRTIC